MCACALLLTDKCGDLSLKHIEDLKPNIACNGQCVSEHSCWIKGVRIVLLEHKRRWCACIDFNHIAVFKLSVKIHLLQSILNNARCRVIQEGVGLRLGGCASAVHKA